MARAVMLNPEVVLLDEPSMGLAPILVAEVFKIIARLKSEGVTMLLVEQFAAAAAGCGGLRLRAGERPHLGARAGREAAQRSVGEGRLPGRRPLSMAALPALWASAGLPVDALARAR